MCVVEDMASTLNGANMRGTLSITPYGVLICEVPKGNWAWTLTEGSQVRATAVGGKFSYSARIDPGASDTL